ncbi:alginate lyase family protein [uncultured Prochlorococcus sp.]|uniref:heparinase II/III family protein n=1 Tax=uncultured Prochlorococcus sp. TaxID=159733 RepID=UPI00258800C1|nr:alginate lyase family protein [uncultured Prochlorococcus sp.]
MHYFDNVNCINNFKYKIRDKKLIYKWINENKLFYGVGWEPYPTSLRIVNWIRWLITLEVIDKKIEKSLILQIRWLSKNIEYHLMGNHLIANAKALIFGGYYFNGKEASDWLKKGEKIIYKELDEQILNDGGHFERSPMYHCIILEDLLDLINIIKSNKSIDNKELLSKLIKKSKLMLSWIERMKHPDGDISFFNDSTFGVSAKPKFLEKYFFELTNFNLKSKSLNKYKLDSSGFSILQNKDIYCLCNTGSIKPSYMPGHSHAETFSFEASFKKNRFIVNPGISIYGNTRKRVLQRSTKFHSTLEIDMKNSSEVWSGFRMANRANVKNRYYKKYLNEELFVAEHDGYINLKGKPIHIRNWNIKPNNLEIIDFIKGSNKHHLSIRFYLHPNCEIIDSDNKSLLIHNKKKNISVLMQWELAFRLRIENSKWNIGFNRYIDNNCINLYISQELPAFNKTIFKVL